MTMKAFLITTTILTCTAVTPDIAFAASPAAVMNAGNENAKTVIASTDARNAASRFVNIVNRARYSLASKDAENAKKDIEAAKLEAAKLAHLSATDRKMASMPSGRIVYDINGNAKTVAPNTDYYYYPIETGSIATKEVGAGPFWSAQKGLGVKDAELVYVTVDLSKVQPMVELDKALADISANKLNAADDVLENLIDHVIAVEDSKDALAIKARDNLELTRNYLEAQNYDAARYPLKHAKAALKAMDGNPRYADQQSAVKKYLAEIDGYQQTIESKDPTALEKMHEGWDKMWNDMKRWVDKKAS